MKRFFETWDSYIEREHAELNELFKKRLENDDKRGWFWNKNMAPLVRKESFLREKLLKCTARERLEIETKIDELVDKQNELKGTYDGMKAEVMKVNEEIKEYIDNYAPQKLVKYANEHHWIW